MAEEAKVGLDNPAFRGRLRVPSLVKRPIVYHARVASIDSVDGLLKQTPPKIPAEASIRPVPPLPTAPTQTVAAGLSVDGMRPQVLAEPAPKARTGKSEKWARPALHLPGKFWFPKSRLQTTLAAMAILVFALGVFVNIQTMLANRSNSAQVSALSKKSTNGSPENDGSTVPDTTKPTARAVANYVVAPNYPRYLIIPKLGVDARVTQVGVTASGALGTPSNVFDAAWYTGSAEPGQPGAVLIDGHVSSWTSKGVFYGIHALVAGDKIQIQRGDGTMFNYRVVKTVVYPSGSVDMQSAMTPITPGKPGLNLITCDGRVIKGTNEFNQRVIVYAEQI